MFCVSLLPASLFLGYAIKRWGWATSVLIEPVSNLCLFPLSPLVFQVGAIYTRTTALEPAGSLDIQQTLIHQALAFFVAILAGTIGHLISLGHTDSSKGLETEVNQYSYPRLKSFREILGWYFRITIGLPFKVPILLLSGGIAILLFVINIPQMILLLVSTFFGDLGFMVASDPEGILILLLKNLFVASPAILLPYLWSDSIQLHKSTRVALSVSLILIWSMAFGFILLFFESF